MTKTRQNYYGSLCTEMYELLHKNAPKDELDFYLSYARSGEKILEPLCGSGRFLVPFLERGLDISGIDSSAEMLNKLKEKAPGAQVVCTDIAEYAPKERFDYIFISSGSVSLFTDTALCKKILHKLKNALTPKGRLIFAVDTVANRLPDDSTYQTSVSVRTKDGLTLVLRSKNRYDKQSQTQFSPGIYQLYDGKRLLQSETMDFQTHLYKFGEMERHLRYIGFTEIATYSSFQKDIAVDESSEAFLFECRL